MCYKFDNYNKPNPLNNKWVRILISIIGGSIIGELLFILSGDPNRPRSDLSRISPLIFMIVFH
jgi:hypothetical protein